eukprot:TRINITY_DN4690_c0_g1_i2.p1 TRINITY_DN4690_c0_g1~~TRINITY_DN4690_c0_g1_i2.p1  ORF type:complete len:247 (+),score=79.21 TRINITY_DN4690_c0_g1_i2:102-842(+)
MDSGESRNFDYREHLEIIESINKQLKDSDERLERSLSTDSRRIHLFKDITSSAQSKVPSASQDNPHIPDSVETHLDRPYSRTAQEDEKVETSLEYLKSIKRTGMFRSDKERIDFLVSEIEILNKRTVILECEIDRLRQEKEQFITRMPVRKNSYIKEEEARVGIKMQKEILAIRKEIGSMKRRGVAIQQSNDSLNEEVKRLEAILEKINGEKEMLRKRFNEQNHTIAEQAKVLEQLKKVIIDKYSQ